MPSSDVLVVGGGAAGLFCAAVAARRGRSVTVLDHADKPGRKILISGGGRCNFTNREVGPDNFLSRNPHFCRSALARYRPEEFLALVESHRIAWEERRHGQLFCTGSAQQIVAMLLKECADAGVQLAYGTRIGEVGHDGRFRVATAKGDFDSARLVVATGGLSIPTIGASDLGYRLAQRFGHAVVETAPALVPLALPGLGDLSGIAVPAEVRADGPAFRENLLFTHHGLSGPAVLQASSYWRPGGTVHIDLLPGEDVPALLQAQRIGGNRTQVGNLLAALLPKRLVQRRLDPRVADILVARLDPAAIAAVVAAIADWEVVPSGTGGYAKAEVTRGGVDTAQLSSQSMESRLLPGLHFIGEVVDVTGWLGGFNFHWAWASASAAGNAM